MADARMRGNPKTAATISRSGRSMRTVSVLRAAACTILIVGCHCWPAQPAERIEDAVTGQEQPEDEAAGGTRSFWDAVTISGVLGFIFQSERSSGAFDPQDPNGWGIPFQPEVSITLGDQDELFFRFGFAAGDGLNGETNFNLAPWGGDLEEDVKNLSGGARDYLLVAWYKHTFEFSENNRLGVTAGIIDATDYLDENEYSNDEYTQFMNAALVNSPNAFVPSYEVGAALEWNWNWFGLRAVAMDVAENEDGLPYTYVGAQVMATANTTLGTGHYRVAVSRSSPDFFDPSQSTLQSRATLLISCDQQLGGIFGAWLRVGRQDDRALIDYDTIISGGFDVSGVLWGREQDNIGIGYGRLSGARQTANSLSSTSVFETYVRFGINDLISVTADIQHINDVYVPAASGNDVAGWIAGIRMTFLF